MRAKSKICATRQISPTVGWFCRILFRLFASRLHILSVSSYNRFPELYEGVTICLQVSKRSEAQNPGLCTRCLWKDYREPECNNSISDVKIKINSLTETLRKLALKATVTKNTSPNTDGMYKPEWFAFKTMEKCMHRFFIIHL